MRRPCGTSATPRAAIASGARPVTSSPTNSDLAAARRQQSQRNIHGGGLAGSVAAEQPQQPRLAQRERDAMQNMAVAVIGVDAESASASVPR